MPVTSATGISRPIKHRSLLDMQLDIAAQAGRAEMRFPARDGFRVEAKLGHVLCERCGRCPRVEFRVQPAAGAPSAAFEPI